MRGLGTAGRAFRLERVRVSRVERRAQESNPVAAHSCSVVPQVTPSAAAWLQRRVSLWDGLFVHHGQGPTPPGEFADDGDVGDDGLLVTLDESGPPIVQAMVAGVASCPGRPVWPGDGPAGGQSDP